MERVIRERTPGLMDASRSYAVLVPLVEREGAWYLLYEVRAMSMRRQPGEVCFPGGATEPGESPEECALRETSEELAIPREKIRLLGRLDFVAHRAGFLMQPVLGVVDTEAAAQMIPNPSEVDHTFLVPLSYLMETEPLEYEYRLEANPGENFPYELIGIPRDYPWQAGVERGPIYRWDSHVVWGLTGRITRNLLQLLKK